MRSLQDESSLIRILCISRAYVRFESMIEEQGRTIFAFEKRGGLFRDREYPSTREKSRFDTSSLEICRVEIRSISRLSSVCCELCFLEGRVFFEGGVINTF